MDSRHSPQPTKPLDNRYYNNDNRSHYTTTRTHSTITRHKRHELGRLATTTRTNIHPATVDRFDKGRNPNDGHDSTGTIERRSIDAILRL
jgi:hypothetical protein